MNQEQFEREKEYESRMSIFRKMLKSGIITKKEYNKIDTIFVKKYAPIFGTLYH